MSARVWAAGAALAAVVLSGCSAPTPSPSATPAPIPPEFPSQLCDALRTDNTVQVALLVNGRRSLGDNQPISTSIAVVQLTCPDQLVRITSLVGS